jgi:hypothetical protein
VVQELSLLGFSPELVRDLVRQGNDDLCSMREKRNPNERAAFVVRSPATSNSGLKLVYEVDNEFGNLAARLRLIIDKDFDVDPTVGETYVGMTRF